ncbi:LysR substrate-binding domain-containing protein [Nocardia sp. R7R-8]|uniref:LysR substrate-binding domain-containing protein n=1 Tax=Nocardia sp. R7R-8 TaxID=3459304 RepID=UPI00403DD34B
MAYPLDLAHLRTLLAIADTGGFRRAADALYLSQPTVSQHIRLLERRLERTIIEKGGRGTRFTADGERFVGEARALLAAHDQMLERFVAVDPDRITIGSTEHAADRLLPELLGVLRGAYPGVYVHFRIDRSTSLTESVVKGALDLAVVLGGSPEPVGAAVGELRLRWAAAPSWRMASGRGPISLLAFEEPCTLRKRALHRLAELGYDVSVTAESGNLDGVMAAAQAGLGVALLPFHSALPPGLVEVPELPAMGSIDVRLVARRGLGPEIELTAVEAITTHYRSMTDRQLRGVA